MSDNYLVGQKVGTLESKWVEWKDEKLVVLMADPLVAL